MTVFTEYIRTNRKVLRIILTNYVYRTSDHIIITHKNVTSPASSGMWPALFGTVEQSTTNTPLWSQYNFYGGRTVVNLTHAGTYSGDGNISYNTPFDYVNYYKFDLNGNVFSILKSSSLDGEYTNVASATVGSTSDDDTNNLIIYPNGGTGVVDQNLYMVEVYRGNELIHKYIPCAGGLYDEVTNEEFLTSATGYIDGPEVAPPTPPTPPAPGFDITLYTTLSEKNRIVKELTEYATVHGTLKERTSVMTPIIRLASGADVLAHVNYLYIPAFERYYFIEEVTSIRTNLTEIRCRCDVLMTYAEGILENEALLKRQENTWNLYLDDGSIQVYNTPRMLTKLFPSGFTTQSLVLAVAGSAQGSAQGSNESS